jgi:nucleotide-binding universal stress UspA family protein
MLDHILIPLDGSPLAAEAISPAKQIVKPNGKITLVTVVDIPSHWEFGLAPVAAFEESRRISEQLLLQAKAYIEEIASRLRGENFQVETVAQLGEAATVIVDTAIARKVDAISMSTHGRSGFSRWLFGSITVKVLSTTPCPVFVIPPKHRIQAEESSHAVSYR